MIISENSYLVLWLNSDADEKILNKRYKELLNFLNIDEVWSYDNDFSFMDYKKIRTEENIKEAFDNLSNQHKKLYQTFFRFQLVDDKDEESMSDIIDWNYVEWSNKWLELFNKTNKYHYLKNHLIWELLFYENKNKFKDLSFTEVPTIIADLLHKLINSDSFWKEFKEIFNIQNEIAVRDDMIESLKNELPQFIAEHFFDISEEIWNSKLYKEFSKKFSISAKELDDNKNVTESIKNIEDTLKSIKDMNLSEELDEIIDGVNEITGEIKKLDKLWLENNPKIIRLKDEFSREIRNMAISLFNDYNDPDNSKNFIEEAINTAYSNSLKEKFKEDIKQLDENTKELEKIGNPHKCWFCKKRNKIDWCEYSFSIHKIVDDSRFLWYGRVRYQRWEIKIPRCEICKKDSKKISNSSLTIWFSTSFIFFLIIALSNQGDRSVIWFLFATGIVWLILWGIIFSIWNWGKYSYNDYPIWKNLQNDWWVKGDEPSK